VFIPDLVTLAEGHPPSPYPFPLPLSKDDRWGMGLLPQGLSLRPVGWLGNSLPTTGPVPDEVVDRLLHAYQANALFIDGTHGWHDCELCPGPEAWYPGGQIGPIITWRGREYRLRGYGHHLICSGTDVFMAPALILHYILDHGYGPPRDFVEAVLNGTFLTPDDLPWAELPPSAETPSA